MPNMMSTIDIHPRLGRFEAATFQHPASEDGQAFSTLDLLVSGSRITLYGSEGDINDLRSVAETLNRLFAPEHERTDHV